MSIIVLFRCQMLWISLVAVSLCWNVRQTNGVYLLGFSSTYNFLSLLSCGSLGQICLPVLCWYKQISQPPSLHFPVESHVVEKHEAGERAIWQDLWVQGETVPWCRTVYPSVSCYDFKHHLDFGENLWIRTMECTKWVTFSFTGQYYPEFPRLVRLLLLYFMLVVSGGGKRFLRAELIHRNRLENLSHFLFQYSVMTVLRFLWIVVLSHITTLIQTWVLSKCSDSVIHHRQIMGRFVWIYLEIVSHS